MILLTGFYRDPDPGRRGELLECLERNSQNATIEEIHVLVEEPADPAEAVQSVSPAAQAKIRTVPQRGRLTFKQLFAYANAQLSGRRVIIANADIYFDASLRRLRDVDLSGRLLCLSRRDVQADGSMRFFEHSASQDAWLFEAPMRAFSCDFPLGVPACENRLAWEAANSGLVVSNPSRSVHANHLHLSGVRRYTEQQRVSGPTREVPAAFLETPWLWFVLGDAGSGIDETISSLAGQARSSCIVVGRTPTGSSVTVPLGNESVSIIAPGALTRTAGDAWNRGAMAIDDDGIICFIEPGTVAAAGFSEQALSHFESDRFLALETDRAGRAAAVVCSKTAFSSVGGCDPAIGDPGRTLLDLRAALRRGRLKEYLLRGLLLSSTGNGGPPAAQLACADTVDDQPLATVTFREDMGCPVKRLTLGTSSHNNDLRPFDAVPEFLIGRPFTQAVACRVSPVEVSFLDAGKLYVLVGTDWDGYYPATAWLSGRARKEALPPVTTASGTGFEVWSLAGVAGEQFVIPTQVVLVADRVVRR